MADTESRTRRGSRLVRPLLIAAGGAHLALGAAMALGPKGFYDALASFPPYNEHFIRDVASFYLALGAVMLVAAARRHWQVPVLVFAVVQYALHAVNHLIDIGDTDPGWMGPVNLVLIAAACAGLWWLMRAADER